MRVSRLLLLAEAFHIGTASLFVVSMAAIASPPVAARAFIAMALVLVVGSMARVAVGEAAVTRSFRLRATMPLVVLAGLIGAIGWVLAVVGGLGGAAQILAASSALYIPYVAVRAAVATRRPSGVLSADSVWLVAQLLVTVALWTAFRDFQLGPLVAWSGGLVLGSLALYFVLRRSPIADDGGAELERPRFGFAAEGALAFAGPQIAFLAATIVLSLEEVADLRLLLASLGPLAIAASGIRLVTVGVSTEGGRGLLPLRVAAWLVALSASWSIAAAVAMTAVGLLSTTDSFSDAALLFPWIILLAVGRALGTSAAPAVAILRSTIEPRVFFLLRLAAVASTVVLAVSFGQLLGLRGALGGTGLGAVLGAALYVSAVNGVGHESR